MIALTSPTECQSAGLVSFFPPHPHLTYIMASTLRQGRNEKWGTGADEWFTSVAVNGRHSQKHPLRLLSIACGSEVGATI